MKDTILARYIKLFVLGSLALFLVTAVCMVLFTFNRMSRSDKLIQAQVEYQEALTKQVGQPQIIRQEYISPMKGK